MSERDRLLARIADAFAGVELGSGISLHEADAIDGYGTSAERRAARAPDEKLDWRRLIDDSELHRLCSIAGSYWSFCDEAGARFHLPACLSFLVAYPGRKWTDETLQVLVFQLTEGSLRALLSPTTLTAEQRHVVHDVMQHLRTQWRYEESEYERAIAALKS